MRSFFKFIVTMGEFGENNLYSLHIVYARVSPYRDHLEVYNAFLKNFGEFRRIDSLPAPVHFPEEGSALLENHTK